jgi:signal transduction histidine kinase
MSTQVPRWVLLASATGFGVSSTLQSFGLTWLRMGRPTPEMLPRLFALNLVYWWVPALVAPSIMGFAQRLRKRGVSWQRQALLHVLVALAYSVMHTAVMVGARLVMAGRGEALGAWWTSILGEYLLQLDWNLTTYLFLVGLGHALAYRGESEVAALNASQLETRLVQARLQALQRQLHPHFLFNTLNTISGLLHADPAGADRMIDRLGDLLRMTLHSSGCQAVPLKEELEVLQKYVEIEQTRFGDRLSFTVNVDPDVLDAQVPQLLLQPLVENAIRHGVAPKARPGWIAVHAARTGGDLTIQVRDSGDGLPPDRLLELNRGVGLDNTRSRLEHLYKSAYRFVFSNMKEGFCVTVRIPFQVAPLPVEHSEAGAGAA